MAAATPVSDVQMVMPVFIRDYREKGENLLRDLTLLGYSVCWMVSRNHHSTVRVVIVINILVDKPENDKRYC